jgi:hypothetical protein
MPQARRPNARAGTTQARHPPSFCPAAASAASRPPTTSMPRSPAAAASPLSTAVGACLSVGRGVFVSQARAKGAGGWARVSVERHDRTACLTAAAPRGRCGCNARTQSPRSSPPHHPRPTSSGRCRRPWRDPPPPTPPVDAPCPQCLRHGDPMHAQERLTGCRSLSSSSITTVSSGSPTSGGQSLNFLVPKMSGFSPPPSSRRDVHAMTLLRLLVDAAAQCTRTEKRLTAAAAALCGLRLSPRIRHWRRRRRSLAPQASGKLRAVRCRVADRRCVSIFLDKNRRYVGKSQSKRPPKRTQRHAHACMSW